jgi:pyrroloquinoline quinone biosynthesis protein D
MKAPAFAKGVRFRRMADGRGVILVPEGVVDLNESAAAIAELIDGERTVAEIVGDLSVRYGIAEGQIVGDVDVLLRRFVDQTWIALDACE